MSRVRSIRTIRIQRAEKDIKSNQNYVREHNWKLATCNKNAPNFWKIPFVRGRNCMIIVFFYIPSNHCLSSILFDSHLVSLILFDSHPTCYQCCLIPISLSAILFDSLPVSMFVYYNWGNKICHSLAHVCRSVIYSECSGFLRQ